MMASGRYPAMHALRLGLALMVVWAHANYIDGSVPSLIVPGVGPGTFAVWGFFFLSGFLVTNSWIQRPEAGRFAIHRIARIWPALLVAVAFSAAVALLSGGSASNAVTFARGLLHDSVSNAYEGTRYAGVLNGSLWSLRWEMGAYLAVLGMGAIGLLDRARFSIGVLVLLLAVLVIDPAGVFEYHGNHAAFSVAFVLAEFVLGMLLAVTRASRRWLWLIAGLGMMAAWTGPQPVQQWASLVFPDALVLGVTLMPARDLPDLPWDWSYGTYIYAWPIEQWVHWRFPGLDPMTLFMITSPVILLLAALSWHYLEEPVLNRAKRYGMAVKIRGVADLS